MTAANLTTHELDSPPWLRVESTLMATARLLRVAFDARLAALMQHASQVGAEPEKLAERIRERAREAGEKPGYAAAEAFKRFQF